VQSLNMPADSASRLYVEFNLGIVCRSLPGKPNSFPTDEISGVLMVMQLYSLSSSCFERRRMVDSVQDSTALFRSGRRERSLGHGAPTRDPTMVPPPYHALSHGYDNLQPKSGGSRCSRQTSHNTITTASV
jgi:hypothetical protein